ncbi:TonB-dependent receptor domain-containing protein [Sphingomonas sp. MMS24-JH45]
MIYGRAATGYRPGGPNPAPPTSTTVPLVFQPDRLTQYEVGLKAQTVDRTVSLETALFYTDWNDIQIQLSGGGFNYLVNGGSARSQGAEATLRVQPARGLNLTGNVGYTDAKLTSAAPAAGGLDGDRLPYVPRWAGSVNADYSVPLGGGNTPR